MRSPRLPLLIGLLALGSLVLPTPAAAEAAPAPPGPGPQTRIIGGTTAPADAYPWQAALIRRGRTTQAGFTCGGTVLSRSWVLTAAHCVLDLRDEYPDHRYGNYVAPTHFDVLTGTNDLFSGAAQRIQVAAIHPHPSYRWQTMENDVALLRLARPTSAPPVTVIGAGEGALDDAGVTATAIGWGAQVVDGPPTSILRHAEVPIQPDATCAARYHASFRPYPGSYPLTFHAASMLCAGPTDGGRDSCQGDSGGPLAVTTETGWRQIGVVSFGYECALAGYPGVYTRLDTFRSWIGTTRRYGPFDPEGTAFIQRQHLDLLGRQPTGAELTSWRQRLATTNPATLVNELVSSPASDATAGTVVRLYSAVFRRLPDTGGLGHWIGRRRAGIGPVAIANAFTDSSEFRRTYGSLGSGAFVDLIYQNVFGRPADAGGRAYWTARLDRGTGRGQVVYELSNSNEYRRLTAADVRIITTRFGLLREAPTAAVLANSRALSQRELIDTLRSSHRYAARFTS